MTRNHLVAAVDAECVRLGFPGALVSGATIEAWCSNQVPPIDYGADEVPANAFFMDADNEEGRTDRRLLKFKTAAEKTAVNHWAKAEHAKAARRAARGRGWVEVLWDGERWAWESAVTPAE